MTEQIYAGVRKIMSDPDWEPVVVTDYGQFITISGQFRGIAHAGHTDMRQDRRDWKGLAQDLDRIAREHWQHLMAKAVETPPEPAPAPPLLPDLGAKEDEPELVDTRDDEIAALRAENERLRFIADRAEQAQAELNAALVEIDEALVVEPPLELDPNVIPDQLATFAQADETAEDFRNRLKRLWQRFGIEDGEHFVGGGEPLTGDEKIRMREIDILLNSDDGRNAGLLRWLYPDETMS